VIQLLGADQRALTFASFQIYLKNNLAKVEVSLAKGEKLHDKREAIYKER